MPRILLIISLLVFVGLACRNGENSTSENTNANSEIDHAGAEQTGESGRTGDSRTVPGGLLNDKAIELPQPAYPPTARAVRASGKVVVNIEVAPSGNVVSAEAKNGHPLLQAAAAAAARQAKFKPGPAPVSGSLEYEFKAP